VEVAASFAALLTAGYHAAALPRRRAEGAAELPPHCIPRSHRIGASRHRAASATSAAATSRCITQLQRILKRWRRNLSPASCADQPELHHHRVCDLVLSSPEGAPADAFKPVAHRVAAKVWTRAGHIKIIGHTDNTAISTVRFPPI